jgi:hypothetical protein
MSVFSIGKEFGLDAPAPMSGSAVSAKNGAPPTGGKGAVPLVMPSSPQPRRGEDTLMEPLMDLEDNGLDNEGKVMFGSYGNTCDTSSPAENEAADIDLLGRTDAAAMAGAFPLVAVTYPPATMDKVPSPHREGGLATVTAVKSDFTTESEATTDDDNHLRGATGSDDVGLESLM